MFLFWFVGGCCLVAIAWSRIRLQMSTKKKLKLKLEELFSASSFRVCLYIKRNLHKILDNFYLNGFHIEKTTSYDNWHPFIEKFWKCNFILVVSTQQFFYVILDFKVSRPKYIFMFIGRFSLDTKITVRAFLNLSGNFWSLLVSPLQGWINSTLSNCLSTILLLEI